MKRFVMSKKMLNMFNQLIVYLISPFKYSLIFVNWSICEVTLKSKKEAYVVLIINNFS